MKKLASSLNAVMYAAAATVLMACAPEPKTRLEQSFASSHPPSQILPSPSATVVPTQLPLTDRSSDADRLETDRNRYEIAAILDWSTHRLQVNQRVLYQNDSGQEHPTLVLNVITEALGGQFDLQSVMNGQGETIDDYMLEGMRLEIPLNQPVAPGMQTELTLKYELALPAIRNGFRWGHLGYFGYSAKQINLALWFPMIAAYDDGWLSPTFHTVGEFTALDMADFVVDVAIMNGPKELRVAGPGKKTRVSQHSWRFELLGARDITLSFSEAFGVLRTSTDEGIEVELYFFEESTQESLEAARHALNTAVDAVVLFERLFGPYPYERLVLVQGDFPDGMEFSGLVFVSDTWFRSWRNQSADWLTLITAHEIAHQWWYAQVGNDQSTAPYLDEALAIYCECLFIEEYHPDDLDWWWDFRVNAYAPTGYVDSSVYEFESAREYINAVYLRGALMMQALRDDLGDKVFFSWLRTYANTMHGTLAEPADFWGALSQTQYAITADTRHEFLKEPNLYSQARELP